MPSYKVIAPGFDGKMYDPNGKRNVLHRDKPFPMKLDEDGKKTKVENVPSWLERMEEVSENTSTDNGLTVKQIKEKLTELGVEFKGNANKATLTELLETAEAAAKVKQDQQDIENASFMGDGESSSDAVETL